MNEIDHNKYNIFYSQNSSDNFKLETWKTEKIKRKKDTQRKKESERKKNMDILFACKIQF